MNMGKTLLIVAIILVTIWYFAPDKFEEGKSWVSEKTGIGGDTTTAVKNPVTKTTVKTNTDTTTTTTANNTNTTEDSEATVLDEDDPCGWPNYGLPDYIGTEKEGDDCADTPTTADLECIANAPKNYDGWINILQTESEPEMRCCKLDGYCRWR